MSLEWGIIRYGGCGNNEQVEETECGETDNDASDSPVDVEEEGGEGTTKEEESGLKHERQTFHDGVEVLGGCSIHLALQMPDIGVHGYRIHTKPKQELRNEAKTSRCSDSKQCYIYASKCGA